MARKGLTDPRMTVDADRAAAVTRADTYGTDMIGWVQKGEGDAPKSRQVKDPFENLYTYGGAIIPPLDPYKLLQLVENNAIHSACVTAKSADSVGRGWTWEAEEKDADVERPKELDRYLEEATPTLSFSELLRQAVMEQETVGWSAWEVQRRSDLDMYTGQEPVYALFPMPSHTIRATQDENVWVQIKNVAIRYFKVFGCRDPYDAITGKPATAKQLKAYMQKDPRAQFEPAREIIVFKSYSPRSPYYGIPPWISAMPAIAELQAIREFNISFFQSGGTVDRIIHVTATDGDQAQVIADKVLTTIKDASGRGHVTVVTSGNTQSEIDVKPMNGPQGPVGGRDAQFVKRREDLIKEVLMAHTVPGYRIGLAEFGSLGGGSSATKEILRSYKVGAIEAAQQVIEDRLNHTLFGPSGLDVRGYRWKLQTLDWDETEMNLSIATQATDSGLLTPNEGRQTLGRERFEDPMMDIPHLNGVPVTSTEEAKTMKGMIGEFKTALEAAIRGPVMTPPPGSGMLGPAQPPVEPSAQPTSPAPHVMPHVMPPVNP